MELGGDTEVCRFAEEVGWSGGVGGSGRSFVRPNSEDFAATFAVIRCQNWWMDMEEAVFLVRHREVRKIYGRRRQENSRRRNHENASPHYFVGVT